MKNDINDIIGGDTERRPKKRNTYYKRKMLGDLHTLIGRSLPYLLGPDNVCNLQKLADELDMTYAGVMKWMRPGKPHRIPPKKADRIVALSEQFAASAAVPKNFKPATKADFLPFLF